MTALRSIPLTTVAEMAPIDGYILLTPDLREEMTREWGRMVVLFETFAASADYADEHFAYNEVGYALGYDEDAAVFVAFTSKQDAEYIITDSDAMFDAIRDEAAAHGEVVIDSLDGVVSIDNGSTTRVALRVTR